MELPTFFADFLEEIRPTHSQKDDYKAGHHTLRERLNADDGLSGIIVSDFLQGSYRRATAIRPKNDCRADVDVIVVTNLDPAKVNPHDAVKLFIPFLRKYYEGRYHIQDRSIAIELSYVDLDLVPTAAPSESQRQALKSKAVTAADTPEDVSDWRLVKSWIPVEERPHRNWTVLSATAKKEAE